MTKAVFLCNSENAVKRVYSGDMMTRLKNSFDLYGEIVSSANLDEHATALGETEFVFSTWGMPSLCAEQIKKYLPKLKAVFYAAGSVKAFAQPFLDNGIKIFSARDANAIPVIETVVAQILLANKGFYRLARKCKKDYRSAQADIEKYKGNYDVKVGIIGLGAISRGVTAQLIKHDIEVYMFSTYASDETIRATGAKPMGLTEIFKTCDVISNHLGNTPETVGIMAHEQFNAMKPYSTFINTGRGAQVNETALIEKLVEDETITAVLDVTYPEPPVIGSTLYELENVVLTPHSAGSSGFEVRRMAQYMIDDAVRLEKGEETKYEVTLEILARMA